MQARAIGVGGQLVHILIAVIDGLKGFPEAIAGVFPETTVQTCIVLLAFTSWKPRKTIMSWIHAETTIQWSRNQGFVDGPVLASSL